MNIEELKKKFLVDTDVAKERFEDLLANMLQHCVVDKKGTVHINDAKMGALKKVKLVLAARYLASKLDGAISASVTAAEITTSTGLPDKQVHARAKDAVDSKFAVTVKPGTYLAVPHKIEPFLDSLQPPAAKK